MTRTDTGIDVVTAEVIRSAMETVCFEMAEHVSRTATTPILNQSNERNATIMDAQGRLSALSVGIPQFMLSSTLPVRFAIDFFGDASTRVTSSWPTIRTTGVGTSRTSMSSLRSSRPRESCCSSRPSSAITGIRVVRSPVATTRWRPTSTPNEDDRATAHGAGD